MPSGSGYLALSRARWPEVEAGPRRLLVVPVGSLEQHGPHLPLDTDTRIAAAVAKRACAAAGTGAAGSGAGLSGAGLSGAGAAGAGAAGVGLAPPVTIGASGEHAGFPGTLSIGTEALTLLLVELGRHASLHWDAMLLVNGHGGNVPAVTAAVRRLRAEGRSCHVWHAGVRQETAGDIRLDAHAGRTETSIMLALAPDEVLLEAAVPGETRPLARLIGELRAHGTRHVSPSGVLGDPAGASAAEGERLLALMAGELAETLGALLSGRAQPA